MIPIFLRLSGFLSYRQPVELDFRPFDLACISGQNGAGKSSLLDALTWVLFGEARSKDKDAIINLQSKAAEVVLVFEYENNLYRVQRTAPRGKTTLLEFQVWEGDWETAARSMTFSGVNSPGNPGRWRPLTEKTLRETQTRIEQTLHLDYDTFINASFFLQGKADQFAQKKPSERKALLSSILGLEVWETYRERAAERRREVEKEIAALERMIADIDAELAEEQTRRRRLQTLETELEQIQAARKAQEEALERLRQIVASLDQRLAEERARLEEERRSLKEQEALVNAQIASLQAWVDQRNQAQADLAQIEASLGQREALEEKRNAAREEASALEAENKLLRREMDDLKARLDQLAQAEGARCPLCDQPLSEQHRRQTIAQLTEQGKMRGDRYRANLSRIEHLRRLVSECEASLSRLAADETRRLTLTSRLAQLNERIEAARSAQARWQATGAPRLQEVESLLAQERLSVAISLPSVNLDEAEQALLRLKEEENQKAQEVGGARQLVEVLETLRARKKTLQAERQAKALLVTRYKTLERAFGKDGVPTLLIEQTLPQIETRANELLDRLTDGQISLRFITQSEYKDARRTDLKETLEILVSDGAGARPYELFSGGEAFRVNFAIRLALAEFLAQRRGARLQTLVIDEGFGSQDAQGRQRLVEAINTIRSDFAKILVITHLDELKDAFPTRIEVEKTDHGSQIRVM